MTFTILSRSGPSEVGYSLAALSRRLALGLLLAAGALAPSAARAEDAPPSPARQLFNDGRKLASEGNYAAACPKLEESLRLELGVGTQFNLADCWEHIGRTASAHALFLGAAASAKAAGQTDREQVLRDRASALEPRLSRLVVEVKSPEPKLTVKRDDLPLDDETLGKAVPLDPGKYKIKARAPGKKPWETTVEITGATPITTVEIPTLEAEKPALAEKPASNKAAAATLEHEETKPTPADSPAGSDRDGETNYRALAVAGAGVLGLGFGAVMGVRYLGANSDAKKICPTNHGCSVKEIQEHDRLVADARTDRGWSYAGFGVGGALLLGAGALWYFERPKATTSKASLQAVPLVSLDGSVGAMVGGRF